MPDPAAITEDSSSSERSDRSGGAEDGLPGNTSHRSASDRQAAILAFLRCITRPGEIFELRALNVPCRGYPKPQVLSGYFDGDNLERMAELAVRISDVGSEERRAKGVYFSLNPVAPELLRRRPNFVRAAVQATRDQDIVGRRLIMVDADPIRDLAPDQVRPGGHSATEGEKLAALDVILAVREYLRGLGWPEPVLTDSGNGYHLLYRVDLPADDGGLVRRALAALAATFSTDRVEIDRKVYNPARICKLPGTWARKGADEAERPHRLARTLVLPQDLETVPSPLLQALADRAPGAGER